MSPDPETPGAPPRPVAGALRVMSFNVRLDRPADGPDRWANRRDAACALVQAWAPDLVGFQEPLAHQVEDIAAALPGYEWVGVGREDGRGRGEFVPVFFRRDRFRLLDAGTFWLSKTPDVPGSQHWDATHPRIATWVRLADEATGETLVHLNTHLDHVGIFARRRGAHLVVDVLAALDPGGGRVLVTADLNARPRSGPHRILVENDRVRLGDARAEADARHGPAPTFVGFGEGKKHPTRIDFVFAGRGFRTLAFWTVPGRPPSDHRPVVADLAYVCSDSAEASSIV